MERFWKVVASTVVKNEVNVLVKRRWCALVIANNIEAAQMAASAYASKAPGVEEFDITSISHMRVDQVCQFAADEPFWRVGLAELFDGKLVKSAVIVDGKDVPSAKLRAEQLVGALVDSEEKVMSVVPIKIDCLIDVKDLFGEQGKPVNAGEEPGISCRKDDGANLIGCRKD